jgi:hypothetical protein
MTDHALDVLLAEYAPPSPPADLARRVVAAALALPQEPRIARARRAARLPRRNRRGTWLRRPLLAGGVALGIAVSGAVAASLAGVKLDGLPLVEAVLARLPFIDRAPPASGGVPAPVLAPPDSPLPLGSPPPAAAPQQSRAAPVTTLKAAEPAVPDEAPALPSSEPARASPENPTPSAIGAAAPPSIIAEERPEFVVTPELRPSAPVVDDRLRQQREQRERAERLRAARQTQIERTQRLQERRERMRRLRRD